MPRQYTPGPMPFLPFTQVELTCEQCGVRFLVSRKKARTQRFCTRACGYDNKRLPVQSTCAECGLPRKARGTYAAS